MCTFYKCHLQFHLTWWKFNIWVRLFCWRSLNTVPCLGVFQSKMSQAVYTAAISQQSVQNMYISNTVQAAPGWQRRQKQRGVHHPDLTVCNDSELVPDSQHTVLLCLLTALVWRSYPWLRSWWPTAAQTGPGDVSPSWIYRARGQRAGPAGQRGYWSRSLNTTQRWSAMGISSSEQREDLDGHSCKCSIIQQDELQTNGEMKQGPQTLTIV